MDTIPYVLQCSYCMKNFSHGGECKGRKNPSNVVGCVLFKYDERGCIQNGDFTISFPLFADIPMLNSWSDNFEIRGVNTQIMILKIHSLSWDRQKGVLNIFCNCDYFINEFHVDYRVPASNKLGLRIVK